MKLCRNCKEWQTTSQWKGNCRKHPFGMDVYSQSANPNYECRGRDYVDKAEHYKELAEDFRSAMSYREFGEE